MTFRLSDTAPVTRLTEDQFRQSCDTALWRQQVDQVATLNLPVAIERKASGAQWLLANRMPRRGAHDVPNYYGYRLGTDMVGLMVAYERRDSLEVSVLMSHPGVENAGDILLEHALQAEGPDARLTLASLDGSSDRRYTQLGFVRDGRPDSNRMVLDPKARPDIWMQRDGSWCRAGKGARYLVAEEDPAPAAAAETQSETESRAGADLRC